MHRRVRIKLKGKFYRMTKTWVMLYGTKCLTVKQKQQQLTKMSVNEMRMLRWIRGKIKEYRIRNVNIRVTW